MSVVGEGVWWWRRESHAWRGSIDRAREPCCRAHCGRARLPAHPLVPTWRSSVRGSARGLSLVLAKQFDVLSDYLPDSSTMQKENSHTPDNHQYVGPYRLEKTLGKGQTGKSSPTLLLTTNFRAGALKKTKSSVLFLR